MLLRYVVDDVKKSKKVKQCMTKKSVDFDAYVNLDFDSTVGMIRVL